MDPSIAAYLQKCRASGMSDEQIRQQLLGGGWTEDQVNQVLGTPAYATSSSNTQQRKSGISPWAIIIPAVLVIAVIGSAFFLMQNGGISKIKSLFQGNIAGGILAKSNVQDANQDYSNIKDTSLNKRTLAFAYKADGVTRDNIDEFFAGLDIDTMKDAWLSDEHYYFTENGEKYFKTINFQAAAGTFGAMLGGEGQAVSMKTTPKDVSFNSLAYFDRKNTQIISIDTEKQGHSTINANTPMEDYFGIHGAPEIHKFGKELPEGYPSVTLWNDPLINAKGLEPYQRPAGSKSVMGKSYKCTKTDLSNPQLVGASNEALRNYNGENSDLVRETYRQADANNVQVLSGTVMYACTDSNNLAIVSLAVMFNDDGKLKGMPKLDKDYRPIPGSEKPADILSGMLTVIIPGGSLTAEEKAFAEHVPDASASFMPNPEWKITVWHDPSDTQFMSKVIASEVGATVDEVSKELYSNKLVS